MIKPMLKAGMLSVMALALMAFNPINVKADTQVDYMVEELEFVTETSYSMKVQKNGINVYKEAAETAAPVATLAKDSIYEVLETIDDSWVKVDLGEEEAYIDTEEGAIVYEVIQEKLDDESNSRKEIAELALSFVGNKYVWGGTDPNRGADCSGFTRYVIGNTVGVNLEHSSVAQSRQGTQVTEEELQVGDLIFYGNGGINHVALYIGDGKVVHASSEKNGIMVSQYKYRQPVKYVSVFK